MQQSEVKTSCAGCGAVEVPLERQSLLSCCGHSGCDACLRARAEHGNCVDASCTASARSDSVVKALSLGGTDSGVAVGGPHGSKLAAIVKLVAEVTKTRKDGGSGGFDGGDDDGDRVLIFVQFPDLMKKVAEALEDAGIPTLNLEGSAHSKTKALSAMQQLSKQASEAGKELQDGRAKVLLLNLKDESASGANLTTANHVIFVHPLLAESQYEFEACETQAVGRVRRYGQQKNVHLWRFMAMDTIDTEIFEERVGPLDQALTAQAPVLGPAAA
ncbi:unnamed protein product [Phaeothamnion confervicola]